MVSINISFKSNNCIIIFIIIMDFVYIFKVIYYYKFINICFNKLLVELKLINALLN